jgi:hypothetical protein
MKFAQLNQPFDVIPQGVIINNVVFGEKTIELWS